MNIKALHSWNLTYKEAVTIQQELRKTLLISDSDNPFNIKTVAGADISYSKNDDSFYAAVSLFDCETMEIIEEKACIERAPFPYIPGLLSFREGPAILKAFEKLKKIPDVVIFDGHGIAHPRGIGLASHMGLFIDIPTIGCAKKKLTGRHDDVGENVGDSSPILIDDQIVGSVLRTKKGVNPVFVSPGHKIGIDSAVSVVLRCLRGYRLPEPVRRAHSLVNLIRMDAATGAYDK